MNCKFCNAEIGEEEQVCPCCGKSQTESAEATVCESVQQEETLQEEAPVPEVQQTQELFETVDVPSCEADEKPAANVPWDDRQWEPVEGVTQPKKRVWPWVLAIVGAVLSLSILAVVLLFAMGVDLIPRANDVYKKDNYTVEDEIAEKKGDKVVAQIEGKTLTNGQMQIYYKEVVYDFLNNNYYYLSTLGLDMEKPLSEQAYYDDENMTWEQYFIEDALGVWRRYTTLQLLAEEAGFQADEDLQAFFEALPTTLSEAATTNGFESTDAWILENYGPGVTQDDIIGYMKTYYIASAYMQSRYTDLSPNDADIDAYFTENEAVFAENGITKDSGNYCDVRHILIEVEGGTTDEDGVTTYSDDDWEACRVKAQEVFDKWKNGDATEESFAALAGEHSADSGSNTNGGLYSNLSADTNFVEEFKQWYLDEGRQPGDTGLVKTTYGYHIMYFSNSTPIWYHNASTQLLSERVTAVIEGGMEKMPMDVTYGRIVLAELDL